jgi:hypothetical protein
MPKNFRKIPNEVRERLHTFALDDVVAACAKRLTPEDVQRYVHLGLRLENGRLIIPPPFVPNASAGKYSRINVEGKDIKRLDLPKIKKEFCFYTPNWGDSSKGWHLICHTRDVYQLDLIPPKELELAITLLEDRDGRFLIKFAIAQVINRRAKDFEAELLYNLNLLQENTGSADVFTSDATLADYAATIRVDWELLPVGQLGAHDAVARLLRGKTAILPEQQAVMEQRLAIFSRLRPTHFIAGTSGFVRYFGAKYADDFVVFENLRYGNALYVMFEHWDQLSQRSRIELLTGDRNGFERIEHREGWEDRLRAMVERYRDTHRVRARTRIPL